MEYKVITISEIEIIRPMWQKLKVLHAEESLHFKKHHEVITFEKRFAPITALPEGDVYISVASGGGAHKGYCVASVHAGFGEIDSLYVDDGIRGGGIGKKIVMDAIAWLKEKGCEKIIVSVACGREAILPFYEKIGFLPRYVSLELKEE